MTGKELLDLTNAITFFRIGDSPGVILKNHHGWIFEGGPTPRPIDQSEIDKSGGYFIPADEAAKLISKQPDAIEFLKRVDSEGKDATISALKK